MQSTALPDRSQLFVRLSEDEIVARYRRVWGPDVGLDELKAQARLEGELTDRLLRSNSGKPLVGVLGGLWPAVQRTAMASDQ